MTDTTHTLKLLKAKIEGRLEILESFLIKTDFMKGKIEGLKKALEDIEELLKEHQTDYSTQS